MSSVGFELAIPASEPPQIRALESATTEMGNNIFSFLFPVALRPNAGHGFLVLEVSISHSLGAPHSMGLLWTSDLPDAETST